MTNDLPPQPASTRPRVTPAVLITAVVAVVVGILLGAAGGYVVANGLGVDEEGSRGERDVAAGCAVLERAREDLPLGQDNVKIDNPVFFELIGAGHLLMAAEQADDEYAAIGELGKDLVAGMTQLEVDLVNSSADELLAECADR